MSALRVGVLGAGEAGRAMALGCIELGYGVRVGTRASGLARASEWARSIGARASTGGFAEATEFADVVILAVRGSAVEAVISTVGPARFRDKLIIDITNPVELVDGQLPRLFTCSSDSLGERVQRMLPGSQVVKAFNTVGSALFVNPVFGAGAQRADMFLAGNDREAKRVVSGLCNQWNWRPMDIGGIEGARVLEPLALFWLAYGQHAGTWGHAIRMLGA